MDSNSTSNLLHAFLDGELDQTNERPLFEELATNNDLRAEMRDLIAIRSAVQHDVEAFSPPYAATNNVFGALGFSLPTSAPVAVPAPILSSVATSTVAAASWWSRLWLPASTLLIGAAITYLLLNWGYSSALATKTEEYNSQIQNLRAESDKAIAFAKENSNRQIVGNEPQIIIKKIYYPVVKYRDVLPPNQLVKNSVSDGNSFSTTANENIQSTTISSVDLRSAPLNEQNGTSNTQEDKSKSMFFASTVTQNAVTGDEGQDISIPQADTPQLLVKFSQNTASLGSTISTNLQPQQAGLNNLNGEFAWAISPSISIGAKIGREAFPMSYSGMTNGRVSRYEQYSSIIWGGLSAQFRSAELSFFGGIQPYFSTLIGGSELGPLVRGELGLQLPLSSHFSISAGTDATGMFYRFQDSNFSTWKFGLNTGVTFHF